MQKFLYAFTVIVFLTFSISALAAENIVVLGDSIAWGGNAGTPPGYLDSSTSPNRWTALLASSGYNGYVDALPGWTAADIYNGRPSGGWSGPSLDTFWTSLGCLKVDYVVMHLGTNDISEDNADAATVESRLTTIINYVHAKGVKIIVGTIMPRTEGTYINNPARDAVNVWIKAKSDGIDGVIDFAPILADPNNPDALASIYDTDGTHPNAAGHNLMYLAVKSALILADNPHVVSLTDLLGNPVTLKDLSGNPVTLKKDIGGTWE
jgi:lysophospholipase L1-like esterase